MPREFKPAQDYEDGDAPAIELKPLTEDESSQISGIGYSPETQTLAVQFRRGARAIYHYPGVSPETHAAFIAAESKGKFHGAHIVQLPFKKYRAPAGDGLTKQPAAA